ENLSLTVPSKEHIPLSSRTRGGFASVANDPRDPDDLAPARPPRRARSRRAPHRANSSDFALLARVLGHPGRGGPWDGIAGAPSSVRASRPGPEPRRLVRFRHPADGGTGTPSRL